MVGIPLSQRQRSALLQSLLQQQPRRNPITAGGAIGQLGGQLAKAFGAKKLLDQQQQQEQQAQQQRQAQLATFAQSVAGQTAAQQPANDPLSQAIRGSGDNPVLAAFAQQGLSQRFGGQGKQFTLSPGQQRFSPGGESIASVPASTEKPKSFFASLEGKDVRVVEKQGQFSVDGKPVAGGDLGPATQRVLQGELGKTVKASLQKEIVAKLDIKRDLAALEEFDAREFLSTAGKLRRFGSEVADRLNFSDEATQKFLQKDVTFRQNTEALFFKIRKEITGAQAAVQELDQLKESVLSTELTPAQFEASRSLYIQKIEQAIGLRQQLLREGITPDSTNFGEVFDSRFGSQDSPQIVNFEDLLQ